MNVKVLHDRLLVDDEDKGAAHVVHMGGAERMVRFTFTLPIHGALPVLAIVQQYRYERRGTKNAVKLGTAALDDRFVVTGDGPLARALLEDARVRAAIGALDVKSLEISVRASAHTTAELAVVGRFPEEPKSFTGARALAASLLAACEARARGTVGDKAGSARGDRDGSAPTLAAAAATTGQDVRARRAHRALTIACKDLAGSVDRIGDGAEARIDLLEAGCDLKGVLRATPKGAAVDVVLAAALPHAAGGAVELRPKSVIARIAAALGDDDEEPAAALHRRFELIGDAAQAAALLPAAGALAALPDGARARLDATAATLIAPVDDDEAAITDAARGLLAAWRALVRARVSA